MRYSGDNLRLPEEPFPGNQIEGDRFLENLDGNRPLEFEIRPPEYDGKGTFPNGTLEFIAVYFLRWEGMDSRDSS